MTVPQYTYDSYMYSYTHTHTHNNKIRTEFLKGYLVLVDRVTLLKYIHSLNHGFPDDMILTYMCSLNDPHL